jgi:hypothetical protein
VLLAVLAMLAVLVSVVRWWQWSMDGMGLTDPMININ